MSQRKQRNEMSVIRVDVTSDLWLSSFVVTLQIQQRNVLVWEPGDVRVFVTNSPHER